MFNQPRAKYLIDQEIDLFPEATLQDIYKLFYQAIFGTSHFIDSKDKAKQMLENELLKLDTNVYPLELDISYVLNIKRVSLYNIILKKISTDRLLNNFIAMSSKKQIFTNAVWIKEWQEIKQLTCDLYPSITQNVNVAIDTNTQLHHSQQYREHYQPHYRLNGF